MPFASTTNRSLDMGWNEAFKKVFNKDFNKVFNKDSSEVDWKDFLQKRPKSRRR